MLQPSNQKNLTSSAGNTISPAVVSPSNVITYDDSSDYLSIMANKSSDELVAQTSGVSDTTASTSNNNSATPQQAQNSNTSSAIDDVITMINEKIAEVTAMMNDLQTNLNKLEELGIDSKTIEVLKDTFNKVFQEKISQLFNDLSTKLTEKLGGLVDINPVAGLDNSASDNSNTDTSSPDNSNDTSGDQTSGTSQSQDNSATTPINNVVTNPVTNPVTSPVDTTPVTQPVAPITTTPITNPVSNPIQTPPANLDLLNLLNNSNSNSSNPVNNAPVNNTPPANNANTNNTSNNVLPNNDVEERLYSNDSDGPTSQTGADGAGSTDYSVFGNKVNAPHILEAFDVDAFYKVVAFPSRWGVPWQEGLDLNNNGSIDDESTSYNMYNNDVITLKLGNIPGISAASAKAELVKIVPNGTTEIMEFTYNLINSGGQLLLEINPTDNVPLYSGENNNLFFKITSGSKSFDALVKVAGDNAPCSVFSPPLYHTVDSNTGEYTLDITGNSITSPEWREGYEVIVKNTAVLKNAAGVKIADLQVGSSYLTADSYGVTLDTNDPAFKALMGGNGKVTIEGNYTPSGSGAELTGNYGPSWKITVMRGYDDAAHKIVDSGDWSEGDVIIPETASAMSADILDFSSVGIANDNADTTMYINSSNDTSDQLPDTSYQLTQDDISAFYSLMNDGGI